VKVKSGSIIDPKSKIPKIASVAALARQIIFLLTRDPRGAVTNVPRRDQNRTAAMQSPVTIKNRTKFKANVTSEFAWATVTPKIKILGFSEVVMKTDFAVIGIKRSQRWSADRQICRANTKR
jgi:hypothetical protein